MPLFLSLTIYYPKIFLFKLVFRNKVICLVLTDTCAFKITMDTVTDAFLEILQIIVWPLKLLFGTVKETAFSLEPLDYPTQFSFSTSVNAQQKIEDS